MSSTSRAWIAAASIGAVEALKDQGVCRWNYAMRSIQQHAKNRARFISTSSSSAAARVSTKLVRDERAKQSEESMRTVMYLSSWAPN